MTISIGQRLKAAREDQRLTIEQVFEATRIRVQYLQALEEDDLSVMPSPVQARGYLRNYAEFLGLDVSKVLDELRESIAQPPAEVVVGPADIQAELSPEPVPAEPESGVVEDVSPLLKPKPARRKKADIQPGDASAAPPKGRTRKRADRALNIETELPAAALAQSDGQSDGAEDGPVTLELELPPEPVPPHEDERENLSEEPRQTQETGTPEPPGIFIESPEIQESSAPADINDSLWQSWLNRLGSILAARNKRQTLTVSEPSAPAEPMEAENISTPAQEQAAPLPDPGKSSQIFKEIGKELQDRRELLSLHLEEVERNTHVKAHYLDALERGAMDELPSTVQTRGMLSNYATFLDLDVDALLLRFADALQARYRERNPQKPPKKPGQPILANLPPMRSFIAGDLIFGVGIVVLLVGFAIWGVSRVLTLQGQQEVDPTAPSISQILLSSPEAVFLTETAPPVPIEAFPGAATATVVIPTLNADVNVQVNLIAAERTYMRVTVDGEVVFEGRVVPGTAYPFEAVDQIEVLAGSGTAIRVVYNGRDMGLLGPFGQVVNNVYLASEVVTPTGMPTPTETATPTPTNTVPPTDTPRFTATPAPSNTAVP